MHVERDLAALVAVLAGVTDLAIGRADELTEIAVCTLHTLTTAGARAPDGNRLATPIVEHVWVVDPQAREARRAAHRRQRAELPLGRRGSTLERGAQASERGAALAKARVGLARVPDLGRGDAGARRLVAEATDLSRGAIEAVGVALRARRGPLRADVVLVAGLKAAVARERACLADEPRLAGFTQLALTACRNPRLANAWLSGAGLRAVEAVGAAVVGAARLADLPRSVADVRPLPTADDGAPRAGHRAASGDAERGE